MRVGDSIARAVAQQTSPAAAAQGDGGAMAGVAGGSGRYQHLRGDWIAQLQARTWGGVRLAEELADAVADGDVGGVGSALDRGANVEAHSVESLTPLHVTVAAPSRTAAAITRLLLEAGATQRPDRSGRTPIHWAARSGALAPLKEVRPDAPRNNTRGLRRMRERASARGREGACICSGHLSARVKQMLRSRVVRGCAGVYEPCLAQMLAAISTPGILECRDEDGRTPALLAAEHGQLDAYSLLLGQGADKAAVDFVGSTALHLAAEAGHVGLVSELVEHHGFDVDAQNECGNSALHRAARRDRFDVVYALLAFGAKVRRA